MFLCMRQGDIINIQLRDIIAAFAEGGKNAAEWEADSTQT